MAEMKTNRTCPYCGGVPYLYREAESHDIYVQFKYLIRCPECGCTTGWHDDEYDAIDDFYGIFDATR